MEYLAPSTGKLYHHLMDLPYLHANSEVSDQVNYLHEAHGEYVSENKVRSEQITLLIRKLIKNCQNQQEFFTMETTGAGEDMLNSNKGHSPNRFSLDMVKETASLGSYSDDFC